MEEEFMVLRDGVNTKLKANQNFKIVSWIDIRTKLSLDNEVVERSNSN